jgi:GT2 family glycosyltransferase
LVVASGQVVAVTDDDVSVDSGWLSALGRGFGRAEGVACVTGLVLPGSLERDAQLWFEEWGGFAKGLDVRIFDHNTRDGVGPLYPYAPGLYGSGNNVAYRTEILRQLGGYDVALGPGTPTCSGEELDLFLSLITGGHRLVYEPAAVVWHTHRTSDEDLTQQLRGYGVGLTALMTKWGRRSPGDLVRRLPSGARVAIGRSAPAARSCLGLPDELHLPAGLRWAERRGMLAGPSAYLTSRRAAGTAVAKGVTAPVDSTAIPGR